MLATPAAELIQSQSFRIVSFILFRRVIALAAIAAGESNYNPSFALLFRHGSSFSSHRARSFDRARN